MAATLNLHRLFSEDEGYLAELKVPDSDARILRRARETIRTALRSAFANWDTYVTRAALFEGRVFKSGEAPRLPAPKFRIQGSFAYHTANDCQQNPPQQIDQDDGVFLPTSFILKDGQHRPGIAAKAYFAIVEGALALVCAANGWKLNPPPKKNTCVRVQLNPRLHIDIPLYSMKDEAFDQLVEAHAQRVFKAAAQVREEIDLDDETYRGLDESDIRLAHRVEGWQDSDPRKLELWFHAAVQLYGPQLRRIVRDLKGFRDARWTECDLSSICLMAAIVVALDGLQLDDKRDDLLLLEVARKLVGVFAEPIDNPAFPGNANCQLCKDWTPEFRAEVCRAFLQLANELQQAIYFTMHKGVSLNHARAAFGPRLPEKTDLIALIGAAAEVRETAASPQPRPVVPRTTSG